MNLKLWLQQEEISIQELADRVRVSRAYMSRIIIGDVHPSLAVALDIRAATRGEVPLEQLLPRALRPADVRPRQAAGQTSPDTARKPSAPKASRPRAAA
jgi:transcriptional regulator with XRE-family HTH domain